jgi:hypothetical protein
MSEQTPATVPFSQAGGGATATGQLNCELTEKVDPAELLEFYSRQRHATSASPDKIKEMIASSHCVVLARVDGKLVGMARGLSDGVTGYLAECKLDPAYQGPAAVTRIDGRIEHDEHGIARAMAHHVLRALRDSGVENIQVLAYGTEVDFCEELGFKRDSTLVALRLDPTRVGDC